MRLIRMIRREVILVISDHLVYRWLLVTRALRLRYESVVVLATMKKRRMRMALWYSGSVGIAVGFVFGGDVGTFHSGLGMSVIYLRGRLA